MTARKSLSRPQPPAIVQHTRKTHCLQFTNIPFVRSLASLLPDQVVHSLCHGLATLIGHQPY